MKEDHIFLSNGRANKRNKSGRTLNYGRVVVHIASAKIPKRKESILLSSFHGQLPDYQSHVSSPIYSVDKFFLKERRTWGQSKISPYCFCVWCESKEFGSRGSSRFPCVTAVLETSSDRVRFRISSNINGGDPLRKQPTGLTHLLLPPTGFQMQIRLEVL